MVNRLVVALASALALFIPMGVVGSGGGPPGQSIFQWAASLVATVDDIGGVNLEPSGPIVFIPIEHEQVVEGHIVFTTMEIQRGPPPPPHNVSVVGLIECQVQVDNITVERLHVDHFFAECHTAGNIFTSSSAMPRPGSPGDLWPTGWQHTDYAPDSGQPVVTTEYGYHTQAKDADGNLRDVIAYCWSSKLVDQGTNPATGHPYNFVLSVDVPRLIEMGSEMGTNPLDHLQIYAQSQLGQDGL
ncbi:MAG: hypothetical protein ACYDCK_01940 [Thermoplasmatota archaeon]